MKVNSNYNAITPLGVMVTNQHQREKSAEGAQLPQDIIDISFEASAVISNENKSEVELFPPGIGYRRTINPYLKVLYTKDREAYHHLYNWHNKIDQFLSKQGEFAITDKNKDWFVENRNKLLPYECAALKMFQADIARSSDPEVRWILDMSISSIQSYLVMLPYSNYTHHKGKLDLPDREILRDCLQVNQLEHQGKEYPFGKYASSSFIRYITAINNYDIEYVLDDMYRSRSEEEFKIIALEFKLHMEECDRRMDEERRIEEQEYRRRGEKPPKLQMDVFTLQVHNRLMKYAEKNMMA